MKTKLYDYCKKWIESEKRLYGSIFILALIVRLAFILTLDQERFYLPDTSDYDKTAVSILQGNGFGSDYDRPPAYPVFLALLYIVVGRNFLALRIIQAIITSLTCIIVLLIGNRVFHSRSVSILAAMVCVLYPYFVFISGILYPEALVTFLISLMVLCLLKTIDSSSKAYPTLAGILLGLSALTKPILLAFLPCIGAWLFFSSDQKKMVFVKFLLLSFMFLLTLTPWTVRNYRMYGKIVPIDPRIGSHLVMSPVMYDIYLSSPEAKEAKKSNMLDEYTYNFNKKVMFILQNRSAFIENYTREFLLFWELYPTRLQMRKKEFREEFHRREQRFVSDNIFVKSYIDYISMFSFGPVLFFALIGICYSWQYRYTASLLFFIIMTFALSHALFAAKTRYRIPIEPYLIIFAAFGMSRVAQCLSRYAPNRWG